MRAVWLASLAVLGCTFEAPQGLVGAYDLPSDSNAGTRVRFLTMRIRDFKRYDAADASTNPAFDNPGGQASEKGIVQEALGPDDKPVYQAPDNAVPTYGKAYFDQWYRDTPGTNFVVIYPLPISLTADGHYEYDSRKSGVADTYLGVQRRVFLPIDDGSAYATPFGNQGASHNYGFTGELHATFSLMQLGATLLVRSDDDCYVFIDRHLVINDGGTHGAGDVPLALDDLGLAQGQEHSFDLFYAERLGSTGELTLTTELELRDFTP